MKKFAIALAVLALAATAADARGRTGSHRSGGYTSHGKGSHYYGGYSDAGKLMILAQTQCNDGSQSGSSGRGTCSHHGGESGH